MEDHAVNTSLMQRMNRIKVLKYIKNNPGSARCTISSDTGLSLGAVTNLTSYLLSEDLITESGYVPEDRVGRRKVKLKLNGKKISVAIVVIKNHRALVYLSDLDGKVKESHILDTRERKIDEITDEISKLILSFKEEITAIGISLSALVLDKGETVISSSLQFEKTNIKSAIEEKTSLPVFVDNISISKAVGFIKKHKELLDKKVVFADMDEGFGAVYINKGEVVRDIPCEIGHTTVEPYGDLCFCGNRGCLEIMLSNESDKKKRNEYLGIGLANLINLFAPKVLITFGGADLAEDEVIKTINNRSYSILSDEISISFENADEEIILEGIAESLWEYIFSLDFKNSIL